MRWTERQRAMLAEMGIVWQPPPGAYREGDAASVAETAEAPSLVAAGDAAAQAIGAIAARSGAAVLSSAAVTPPATTPPGTANRAPLAAAAPAADADATVAARPDRARIATLDWPGLREAVVACRACKLCESRRQTVFGVGHERADWMIVGEAPGEQEDRQGEPFVGKSGQLLDNMLRAIGLTRAPAEPERQVFIANTLKCRPPGNRNPEPEELVKCEPFLIRQIQLVQPKVILAMGAFAIQSLLRSTDPVGRLRGRVHRYQGVPLVATYHPAYLLRNPVDKAKSWDDLCLALEARRGA